MAYYSTKKQIRTFEYRIQWNINIRETNLDEKIVCKILYFELGIFSFNSHVYYLTGGFIALALAFNLLTHAFNLPTRAFNLKNCVFSLITCGF